MRKKILLTGATDGIGRATAQSLAELGHELLLHGRSADKLAAVREELAALPGDASINTVVCDLSRLTDVDAFARNVAQTHPGIDVVINNAGIYSAPNNTTACGLDIRFVVNTIAPFLLTTHLLPTLADSARIVNVSSAGQAPVEHEALRGERTLDDYAAYAQSKLAVMMWTRSMANERRSDSRVFVSVNPGSLLGSKMVRDNFDRVNGEVTIGADILVRAALSEEFASASGKYFDNDAGHFAPPHPDGSDERKCRELVAAIVAVLAGQV